MNTKDEIVPSNSHSVRTRWSENDAKFLQATPNWRDAMRLAVRSGAELLKLLQLEGKILTSEKAARDFPVFVPHEFLQRMEIGNSDDPLLRQVLAINEETEQIAGFTTDAVHDADSLLAPGLLRKYSSRALAITTGACAIHCRYCFRRHYPYTESPRNLEQWIPTLNVLREHTEINEVIFSGGDPLTIVDTTLQELINYIANEFLHIKRLRIHTRLPIVIPQRVTEELLSSLVNTRLTSIMVVHVNHAQEIDGATSHALQQLAQAGIPLLNQTVLLRGVNDNVPALIQLSEALVDNRVMPYYLHQLDRVQGAAHFEVPLAKGMLMVEEMRKALPGYAVPRFVREVPGESSKQVLV
jgi:EF-P beta-lysylation protein EpmB